MNEKIKPIIFANPVRDLTLARYLAAMEVDYFGIDLDDPDPNKTKTFIHQIREWVEGPKLIGVSATPPKNIADLFPLHGYYLDTDIDLSKDSILFQSHHYLLNHPDSQAQYIIVEHEQDLIENRNCILKMNIELSRNFNSKISGYMIFPGIEEKTGIYDFEQLDKWFEEMNKDK